MAEMTEITEKTKMAKKLKKAKNGAKFDPNSHLSFVEFNRTSE